MSAPRTLLLILDLDETLIHSTDKSLGRSPDALVGPHLVYFRPGLSEFLINSATRFEIAVWSSSSPDYANAVVDASFPAHVVPAFIWGRDRCTSRFDPEFQCQYFLKDLKKVQRRGFDLRRTLIVDDTPQKVERHYGNAVYIKPFLGNDEDCELRYLDRYLTTLAEVEDVRRIEKRGWRNHSS